MGMHFGDSIKSGQNVSDTWKRMLTQIPAVSEKMANSIVQKYPTARAFFHAIQNLSRKANALIGIEVPMESGRVQHIGPIIAQRIVNVLLDTNPDKKVLE
jgi:hypothetical protein